MTRRGGDGTQTIQVPAARPRTAPKSRSRSSNLALTSETVSESFHLRPLRGGGGGGQASANGVNKLLHLVKV